LFRFIFAFFLDVSLFLPFLNGLFMRGRSIIYIKDSASGEDGSVEEAWTGYARQAEMCTFIYPVSISISL